MKKRIDLLCEKYKIKQCWKDERSHGSKSKTIIYIPSITVLNCQLLLTRVIHVYIFKNIIKKIKPKYY